jgi:hypothetical protein
MLMNTFSLLLVAVIAINSGYATSRASQNQDDGFNAKVVNLALTQISQTGPNPEIAAFVSRAPDLFWPRRDELAKVTEPYLEAQDTSKAAAAVAIFYRLRSHRPMMGIMDIQPGEDTWEKQNSDFFNQLDRVIYAKLDRLLLVKDRSLLSNLAQYLGVSRSPASKKALLQIANDPEAGEQAVICLGWHKDPNDIEDLFAFMMKDNRAASNLPYIFRNNYGAAAEPYLLKALAQAPSPFTRLQAAEQLIYLNNNKAGITYLFEAIRDRERLPNGRAQAGEIMAFVKNHMGFQGDWQDMDGLLEFLKSKSKP